jgi:hypothetical protein
MWECTFTATWPKYSRPTIEEVSTPVFTAFWLIYIVGVNFTVMRVVSSLFLKQTLQVAAENESELKERSKKAKAKLFEHNLREVFLKSDVSGDGTLSEDEFHGMLMDEEVSALFADMEFNMDDVLMLFNVLASDSDAGGASYEAFLQLALHVKDGASKIDIVQNFNKLLKVQEEVRRVQDWIELLVFAKGGDSLEGMLDESESNTGEPRFSGSTYSRGTGLSREDDDEEEAVEAFDNSPRQSPRQCPRISPRSLRLCPSRTTEHPTPFVHNFTKSTDGSLTEDAEGLGVLAVSAA